MDETPHNQHYAGTRSYAGMSFQPPVFALPAISYAPSQLQAPNSLFSYLPFFMKLIIQNPYLFLIR